MAHGAVGTLFTFILLNCIEEGNFSSCVLILASPHIKHLVWKGFWFPTCQSYEFICLRPSGQRAISTLRCK